MPEYTAKNYTLWNVNKSIARPVRRGSVSVKLNSGPLPAESNGVSEFRQEAYKLCFCAYVVKIWPK